MRHQNKTKPEAESFCYLQAMQIEKPCQNLLCQKLEPLGVLSPFQA
jgi:hypothetical protein